MENIFFPSTPLFLSVYQFPLADTVRPSQTRVIIIIQRVTKYNQLLDLEQYKYKMCKWRYI